MPTFKKGDLVRAKITKPAYYSEFNGNKKVELHPLRTCLIGATNVSPVVRMRGTTRNDGEDWDESFYCVDFLVGDETWRASAYEDELELITRSGYKALLPESKEILFLLHRGGCLWHGGRGVAAVENSGLVHAKPVPNLVEWQLKHLGLIYLKPLVDFDAAVLRCIRELDPTYTDDDRVMGINDRGKSVVRRHFGGGPATVDEKGHFS